MNMTARINPFAEQDARENRLVRGPYGFYRTEAPRRIQPVPDLREYVAESAVDTVLAEQNKLDSSVVEVVEMKLDAGSKLDASKIEHTSVGGIKVPIRIARVGVLTYRNGISERREFRPPEEVSRPESLQTFEGAPIIDFSDHVALVTTEDFRKKTVGHISNVRMDGEYVAADAYINDAATIEMIDRGERLDASAGYTSKDERSSGMWRGEKYDLIQRDIVGNHVALCPPNRGRSGSEVGLRLDSAGIWGPR